MAEARFALIAAKKKFGISWDDGFKPFLNFPEIGKIKVKTLGAWFPGVMLVTQPIRATYDLTTRLLCYLICMANYSTLCEKNRHGIFCAKMK